jgi:hypothetical protein
MLHECVNYSRASIIQLAPVVAAPQSTGQCFHACTSTISANVDYWSKVVRCGVCACVKSLTGKMTGKKHSLVIA